MLSEESHFSSIANVTALNPVYGRNGTMLPRTNHAQALNIPLRVLFLQASWELTPEYTIQRLLAEHADPSRLDCYFIWQDHTHDRRMNQPVKLARPNRNFFWDFGRNMSVTPKPSKLCRAMMMIARLPASLLFLLRKVREIQPDIIYVSQQQYDIRLACIMWLFFRVPMAVHIYYPVGPWLGRDIGWVIRTNPMLITISHYIAETAVAFGVPPERIRVCYNPADYERFDVPHERERLRAEFGYSLDTPIVVSAGRLDVSKGHKLLLEAFSHVHHEMPEARLVICGKSTMGDHYDDMLMRLRDELGLGECVVFAGPRPDLPYIFGGSDIFCLPTENEALGLVFLEAGVSGLPVVACHSGAVPEVIENGVTGLLSRLGDAEALARNLLTLLRDPGLRMHMGEAARAHVARAFSPSQLGAEWEQTVCEYALGQPAPLSERQPDDAVPL
jgi:glycosyltransferase involved in cell wall biosynthesis